MSFYKRLASWATRMDTEDIKRKQSRRSLTAGERPLTKADFQNTMHGFEGIIGKHFEVTGALVVQHMNRCFSDLAVICRDMLKDSFEKLKEWNDHTAMILWKNLEGSFQRLNTNAEKRWQEADRRAGRRQDRLMSAMVGLVKFFETKELNDANRFLELMERIRVMEQRLGEDSNVVFNTSIGLHQNLTEQLQAIRRDLGIQQADAAPTLEWLMSSKDQLIQLGEALAQLRDGTIPPKPAGFAVIKNVRALLGENLRDIQDAVDKIANEWGVLEESVAEAA